MSDVNLEIGGDGGEHTSTEGGGSEAEHEAKLFGWNPDYEGPGKKSAEEFLEEGKRINGFLRKDLDKIRAELGKLCVMVTAPRLLRLRIALRS